MNGFAQHIQRFLRGDEFIPDKLHKTVVQYLQIFQLIVQGALFLRILHQPGNILYRYAVLHEFGYGAFDFVDVTLLL